MNIFIIFLPFIMIAETLAKNYRIYSNKNLNETEWQSSLLKTTISLDQMVCLLDCSRVPKCALISFNQINKNCKYYNN